MIKRRGKKKKAKPRAPAGILARLSRLGQHSILYFFTAALAVSSLSSVVFLWRSPLVLTVAMGAIALAMLSLNPSKRELAFFVLTAVFGTLAEVMGIYSGAWVYMVSPTPYVPPWLPVLWGIAAVFMVRLRDAAYELIR